MSVSDVEAVEHLEGLARRVAEFLADGFGHALDRPDARETAGADAGLQRPGGATGEDPGADSGDGVVADGAVDDELRPGQLTFEATGERQAGVPGTENDDSHTLCTRRGTMSPASAPASLPRGRRAVGVVDEHGDGVHDVALVSVGQRHLV